MKIDNVADLIAETLAQASVKRIFGVVGDSLRSRGVITAGPHTP
jgi:hypothetical protein